MNKNQENRVLIVIIFVVAAGLAFAVVQVFMQDKIPVSSTQATSPAGLQTITTGTTNSGDVSISLTPRQEGTSLVFDLAANTHSVSLESVDLAKQAVLEIEGTVLNPVSAPTMSGHHVSGKLVFASSLPTKFTVTIQGIPAIQERIFSWDLST